MEIPVALFGLGGVGQSLLEHLLADRDGLLERERLSFEISAVIDSKSWASKDGGLDDGQIRELIQRKRADGSLRGSKPELAGIWAELTRRSGDFGIAVDATAANGMEEVVDQALDHGFGVVLANKKPLTSTWSESGQYYHNPLVRYEATVGGGLPIIATLRYLKDTGDTIHSIEGGMSGTLSTITRKMDEGFSFSQALQEAMNSGVTEPDPREDLKGLDVMRKLLIMGRTAGWPLEQSDIEVESLVPPPLVNLLPNEFMASVDLLDRPIKEWVKAADKSGLVLRYLARVTPDHGEVGLKAIPSSTPMASSKMFAIRSARYRDEPLLIGSDTSGVLTTAAGVLGDMISMVRERQKR